MRKRIVASVLIAILSISLTACGKKGNDDENKVVIGAVLTPHSEILEQVKPKLKEEGIDLEIKVFDDSSQLNPALKDGEIDANYFQHKQYLDSVADEKGFDFEVAGNIHVEPIGLYSDKIKSLDELKDGDTIVVPEDASNEYRAFLLLEKHGIIKLKSDASNKTATVNDIEENPKHLVFKELDAYQIPRSLQDVTAAIINTNVALQSDIDTSKTIIKEGSDSPYANIITVRKGEKDKEKIKKLVEALQSDDIKKFIEEKYNGAVIPAF